MSQRPTDDGDDWTARHARCRSDRERPPVIADEPEDDWERRHAETRRSRPS